MAKWFSCCACMSGESKNEKKKGMAFEGGFEEEYLLQSSVVSTLENNRYCPGVRTGTDSPVLHIEDFQMQENVQSGEIVASYKKQTSEAEMILCECLDYEGVANHLVEEIIKNSLMICSREGTLERGFQCNACSASSSEFSGTSSKDDSWVNEDDAASTFVSDLLCRVVKNLEKETTTMRRKSDIQLNCVAVAEDQSGSSAVVEETLASEYVNRTCTETEIDPTADVSESVDSLSWDDYDTTTQQIHNDATHWPLLIPSHGVE